MLSGISIETFRGDLEELEQMAHLSWRDEYGIESFPNFYRPAFLKFLFDRIQDKDHLIAAYRGDEIVSFLANLPQRFCFDQKIYRGVYSCLMVTRKELLRKGIGKALIEAALQLNQKFHYDFSLLTLEKGHRSTMMIRKLEETGHPVEWVKRNYVVARVLDLERVACSEGLKGWEKAAIRIIGAHRSPKRRSSVPFREYRKEDLNQCLSLLNRYGEKIRLALFWEPEELEWELDYPGVSQTLVYEKAGEVAGLINFISHEHLGKTREKWAWINHVAYPGLTPRERLQFVDAFLCYIQDAGFVGATEWTRKYYPMEPFYRARFFPYFRYVNLVSWTFNPELSLKNVPAVYEVQI
jgi:GNAT superfamily N-acetyltransferase